MKSWRDAILHQFVPNVRPLTLVADPDHLMTEEKLVLELRRRGFDMLEFTQAVEFRYVYESTYREAWDRGEHSELVVIVHRQQSELASLPYDLLQAGQPLSFSLGEIFPHLSYPVIEQIDRRLLDPLYQAQQKSPPERMGDRATKDYILRHVFGIAPELISNEVELLRALLRLHYGGIQIPPSLAQRLVQVLHGHGAFQEWPLAEIIPDEEAFYSFLQERWPVYLSRHGKNNQVGESSPEYHLDYPGPGVLPFGHQDVRVYMDNLFLEGKLTPVRDTGFQVESDAWVRCGIASAREEDEDERINRLLGRLDAESPSADATYSDWITFALKWAELTAQVYRAGEASHRSRLMEVGETLNETFAHWLEEHYANLINLPPTHPVMVHHIPRYLARVMEDSAGCRVALVVVDGLSLDQWVTTRQVLQEQDTKLVMREAAIFAWIPTLTAVSRQSIFAGKPPLYFPSSIQSTNSEEKLWKQFWENQGLTKQCVVYQRGLGDGDASSVLERIIHPYETKAVGLVVDKVDKIMHGMQLGSSGMHNQISQWVQGGFLHALVGYLLDRDYEVWLTSDHGNIECEGMGRPAEGVIVETPGERVRVYSSPDFRVKTAAQFAFAREWPPIGLPAGYFPLVAGGRAAFVNPGNTLVGHGGISLEEVMVPFVKCERSAR